MARDYFHEHVREALEKSGWKITDDPLKLGRGLAQYQVDLGAEQLFAAEKGPERIAVEVKSFVGNSAVSEFHKAVGQFVDYEIALEELDPERSLFLAIPLATYENFIKEELIERSLVRIKAKLLVYNPVTKSIVSWRSY